MGEASTNRVRQLGGGQQQGWRLGGQRPQGGLAAAVAAASSLGGLRRGWKGLGGWGGRCSRVGWWQQRSPSRQGAAARVAVQLHSAMASACGGSAAAQCSGQGMRRQCSRRGVMRAHTHWEGQCAARAGARAGRQAAMAGGQAGRQAWGAGRRGAHPTDPGHPAHLHPTRLCPPPPHPALCATHHLRLYHCSANRSGPPTPPRSAAARSASTAC